MKKRFGSQHQIILEIEERKKEKIRKNKTKSNKLM